MHQNLDDRIKTITNRFNEHNANWGYVGSAAQAVKELQQINEFLS